jgi:hypothetical protein
MLQQVIGYTAGLFLLFALGTAYFVAWISVAHPEMAKPQRPADSHIETRR